MMKERGELLKQYPGIDKGMGLGAYREDLGLFKSLGTSSIGVGRVV